MRPDLNDLMIHAPMHTLDQGTVGDHIDRLYRAALFLTRSREDAEDLVQDTYARVLGKPRLVRGDNDLTYLMKALRNTFLSNRRAARRRPQPTVALDDVELIDARSGTRPETAFANHELLDAIASLPINFRLTLIAVDVAGLSYREAARALGTREETLTTRLYRARQRVGRVLIDREPANETV